MQRGSIDSGAGSPGYSDFDDYSGDDAGCRGATTRHRTKRSYDGSSSSSSCGSPTSVDLIDVDDNACDGDAFVAPAASGVGRRPLAQPPLKRRNFVVGPASSPSPSSDTTDGFFVGGSSFPRRPPSVDHVRTPCQNFLDEDGDPSAAATAARSRPGSPATQTDPALHAMADAANSSQPRQRGGERAQAPLVEMGTLELNFNPKKPIVRKDVHRGIDCRVVREIHRDEEEAARLRGLLDELMVKFFPNGLTVDHEKDVLHEAEDALVLFNLKRDSRVTSEEQLDETYNRLFVECCQLFSQLQRAEMLSDVDVDSKVRHILDRLKVCRELLGFLFANATCATKMGLGGNVAQTQDDHAMWRFQSRDVEDELTSYQTLLVYLIDKAQADGYCRYRDSMMLPVRTAEGVCTGAWKAVKTFSEFVTDITQSKLTNNGMWYHLTKEKGNFAAAVEYLAYSKDPEVPWLKPDRHIFCFKNGMYMARDERFVPYGDFAEVFPYGPPVACKYFDVSVDYDTIAALSDYIDIPTPAFDQIMNSQNITPVVIRWVLALFFGRMIYDTGELDDYQIHVFVKGMANTGKSKLLEAVASMYSNEDVGVLPNNIEEKFGLAIIAHKFIAIADDVRRTLKLDQSDFQNMSSANRVSCPRKHKDPLLVPHWACGVVWSGNEVPDFQDNAGSFSRRLIVLLFENLITEVDMTLGARLEKEIPLLIIKGNWAYQNLLRRYGTKGIWEIAPTQFKEQRQELASGTNALTNLLTSGIFRFGKDCYMPLNNVRDLVMEHAKKNGFASIKWCPDFYRGPFNLNGVKVEKANKEWPKYQKETPKRRMHTTFAIGCELSMYSAQQQPQTPQQQTQ